MHILCTFKIFNSNVNSKITVNPKFDSQMMMLNKPSDKEPLKKFILKCMDNGWVNKKIRNATNMDKVQKLPSGVRPVLLFIAIQRSRTWRINKPEHLTRQMPMVALVKSVMSTINHLTEQADQWFPWTCGTLVEGELFQTYKYTDRHIFNFFSTKQE